MSHTIPPPEGPRHDLQPPPGMYQVGGPPDPSLAPPPKRRRWPLIVGGLLAVLGLGSCLASLPGEQSAAPAAVPAPTVTVTVTSAPAAPVTVTASAPSKPTVPAAEPEPEPTTEAPKPKPTAPQMTVSQENAVETATSYLESGGFSKTGLIEQLKFEDYSTGDAKFAVGHLEKQGTADWNAEAVETAESYMDGDSFSRGGLIQQLKFEGFTQKQAEYGAKKVGL